MAVQEQETLTVEEATAFISRLVDSDLMTQRPFRQFRSELKLLDHDLSLGDKLNAKPAAATEKSPGQQAADSAANPTPAQRKEAIKSAQ